MNAITDAVRKRNRTCPSVRARRNARSSSTGRHDELDPAWDPDRRASSLAHAAIVALRPAAGPQLNPASACATVRPMASPRSRQAARLRERRRRAQRRARRLVRPLRARRARPRHARSSPRSGPAARARRHRSPFETTPWPRRAGRPAASADARDDRQPPDPAAGRRAALTAIGFHGSSDGSLSLQPVGRQANEGILARLWRRIAGARRDAPRWYQLEGGPPGTNVLDVGTRAGHRRLRARRRAPSSPCASSSSAAGRSGAASTSARRGRRR